jgi:hypothetical protein
MPIEDSFARSSAISSDILRVSFLEGGKLRQVDLTEISADRRASIGGSEARIIIGDDEAALVGTGFRDSLGK